MENDTSSVEKSLENFLTGFDALVPETETEVTHTIGVDLLNPSSFTDMEDEDEEQGDKEAYFYKKANSREILKANYKLALAIDPSERGSGFAIWDNRQGQEALYTEVSSLGKIRDTKEDPLNYFKMQKEFSDDLLGVLEMHVPDFREATFDLVIIEDTILRRSAQVFKRLVLINHVIDHLVAGEVINTDKFIRVNNKTWKKHFFTYKGGKQYKDDKIEIENTLKYLDEPLVLENYHQSKAWKDKNNYQDTLDALAMMIVGNDIDKEYKSGNHKKKKHSFKYDLLLQKPEKGVEIVIIAPTEHVIEDTIEDLRKEMKKQRYYIKVKRGTLGNFGIRNNLIFPLGVEEAYLYLY